MNGLLFIIILCGMFSSNYCRKVNSRPSVVNVGSVLTFDSYIGRVSKIAIELAVKDVNANPSILPGTRLALSMADSNCSGLLGMVEALQFMQTKVMAIIGPQSSVVAHIISHVVNALRVPLVTFGATDPTLSSLQFPYLVRATQSDLYQMSAVADIVDYYNWKQVTAIYIDNDFGRNGIAILSDKLSRNGGRISDKFGLAEFGLSTAGVMDALVKVALLESRVIVLHVYPDMGLTIMSVVKYLGMMADGYVWIATDWLSTVLDTNSSLSDDTMNTLQGVLTLRHHSPDSARKKAFKLRWNKITGGYPGLNSYGLYAYDAVWLLANAIDTFFNQDGVISFSNDSWLSSVKSSSILERFSVFDGGKQLLRHIMEEGVDGLSGPIRFNSDGAIAFPSYDIINVIGTGFKMIGFWSNYSGLYTAPPATINTTAQNRTKAEWQLGSVIWPGDATVPPRGWVFPNNGMQLKIGVPVRVSFRQFLSQTQDAGSFQGYCIDVFVAAVNLLPYPVPYHFVPQGDGRDSPSYTGMVKKIVTGELDGVVGDVAIVTNRTKIVDFTQPYVASGLVVVAPFKVLNTGAWAFLSPFSTSMWVVTVSFFIVVGFVVWILEHRINDEFRGPPKRQVITVVWFSLSTLFFSHRENTVSTLGRMVLIIWLFVVLIINSSYTASLTSILTVQQLSSPIKGIDSLKESNEPIGFQQGSFSENYLSNELGIAKARLVALKTPAEYAEALLKGPGNGGVAAVVDERPYIELFLASNCGFRIVGQEFTKSGWGFAFPKDSPLAIDLSTAILRLSENGDLQRIHDKWLSVSSCSSDTQIDSNRLHLKSFWGLFLICGIAFAVALLIYFLQITYQLYTTKTETSSPTAGNGSSKSRRLQRFLTLIDEKEEQIASRRKRRKLEAESSLESQHPSRVNSFT